jgi:hypothetical protein
MSAVWVVYNQSYDETSVYPSKKKMLKRMERDAESYTNNGESAQVFKVNENYYTIGWDPENPDDDPIVSATLMEESDIEDDEE